MPPENRDAAYVWDMLDAARTIQKFPWRQIIAQRNVLAHDYGEIKQDRIWLVATTRIPEPGALPLAY